MHNAAIGAVLPAALCPPGEDGTNYSNTSPSHKLLTAIIMLHKFRPCLQVMVSTGWDRPTWKLEIHNPSSSSRTLLGANGANGARGDQQSPAVWCMHLCIRIKFAWCNVYSKSSKLHIAVRIDQEKGCAKTWTNVAVPCWAFYNPSTCLFWHYNAHLLRFSLITLIGFVSRCSCDKAVIHHLCTSCPVPNTTLTITD